MNLEHGIKSSEMVFVGGEDSLWQVNCICGLTFKAWYKSTAKRLFENHIPVQTFEWGVLWTWSAVVEPNATKESAKWRATNLHSKDGKVVYRKVTEWILSENG